MSRTNTSSTSAGMYSPSERLSDPRAAAAAKACCPTGLPGRASVLASPNILGSMEEIRAREDARPPVNAPEVGRYGGALRGVWQAGRVLLALLLLAGTARPAPLFVSGKTDLAPGPGEGEEPDRGPQGEFHRPPPGNGCAALPRAPTVYRVFLNGRFSWATDRLGGRTATSAWMKGPDREAPAGR